MSDEHNGSDSGEPSTTEATKSDDNEGSSSEGPSIADAFQKEATFSFLTECCEKVMARKLGEYDDADELSDILKMMISFRQNARCAIRGRYERVLNEDTMREAEEEAKQDAARWYRWWRKRQRTSARSAASPPAPRHDSSQTSLAGAPEQRGGDLSPASRASAQLSQSESYYASAEDSSSDEDSVDSIDEGGQSPRARTALGASDEVDAPERRLPTRLPTRPSRESTSGASTGESNQAAAAKDKNEVEPRGPNMQGRGERDSRVNGSGRNLPRSDSNGDRAARRNELPQNAGLPGQSDDQSATTRIEDESRHLDIDVRPLEQLLTRLDACTDEDLLIPAETSIIRVVQLLFSRTFESAGNLHRIPELTTEFLRIIGPLSNYCKLLAPRLRSTANEAQLTPDLSTGQSIGAMLLECESSQEQSSGELESAEVSKQLLELKKALYRHKNGDKSTHKNYEKAIKDAKLYDFIRVCNPTKNHVTFVLHLAFVYHFICDMTVFEGIDHLGRNSTRLWARLEKFAAKVDTDVPFNRGTTILAFLVSFVSPSIDTMDEDQLWVEASILTCEVFSCLTQIQTKNLARHGGSANVDPRQERLLGCCRGAESNVVGGGSALGQIEDDKWYCSGLGEKQGDRRMRAFRTFLCMLLKNPIQRRLPPNFFSKRGHTRTFLRLSASEYRKHGTFLTPKFFESNQGMNSKFAQGIRKGVVQKKVKGNDDDTGEQNIVISNRAQVSSLRRLVEAVSAGR